MTEKQKKTQEDLIALLKTGYFSAAEVAARTGCAKVTAYARIHRLEIRGKIRTSTVRQEAEKSRRGPHVVRYTYQG